MFDYKFTTYVVSSEPLIPINKLSPVRLLLSLISSLIVLHMGSAVWSLLMPPDSIAQRISPSSLRFR